jgi:hypothetical protein
VPRAPLRHPAPKDRRALKTLAGRSTLPVEIRELPHERLPAPVEAAAYFVVSEALANAARHAQSFSHHRGRRVRRRLARRQGEG